MANLDALLRIRTDVQGANSIVALNRGLQGVERTAAGASVAMRGLQVSLGGVLGLAGGATILSKIFGDTATLQTQTRSLEVLLGSASKASQIVKELQAYGSVTPFESTELIETAKRLGAFGIAGQRVVEVTKRLGDVAGATGSSLGELATAYGQVVAKGRLQTEELLQFQERGVGIQGELQKMYGLSGQELQKALSDGRVSSEAFEQAIVRLTDKGGKYANGAIAQSDTLNGRLSTLRDTVTSLSQTIGSVLEPALSRILLIATNTVDTINRAMRAALLGPQNADTIAQVNAGQLPFGTAGVDKLIGEQRRKALQGQSAGFLGMMDQGKFLKLLQQQPEFRPPSSAGSRVAPLVVPALTGGTRAAGGGGGVGKTDQGIQGYYLQGGIGPSGPNAYGPHYDIKRVDGRYFSRNALDPYVSVNGRPLSAGTTVSGGQFGAMRDGGARVHNAWDYAFGGSAKLSLKGGAKWVGSSKGSYGDNTAFQTPDGNVYRLIHGTFKATGKGAAADAWKDNAQIEEDQARAAQKAKEDAKRKAEDDAKGLSTARETLYTKQALLKIAEATNPMAKLEAEFEKEKADRMRDYAARLAAAGTDQARQAEVASQIADIRLSEVNYQKQFIDLTAQQLTQERERADLLAESMARMEELNSRSSAGAGFQQGLQGYVDSVGTLRDAVGQLTTNSIGGLEDSLTELATTGTTNFKAFAASVLQDTSRMIIRQLVLKTIMQIIGGIGGGAGSNFEMPNQAFIPSGGYGFAKGGIFGADLVTSPTLFKFASGGAFRAGLMGEAGPEAIMPLRRGSDGRLGVAAAGGSSNTINISVDASGTKASGDQGTGAALARDLARVVDDRLIHHRRPGGLLAA